MNLNRKSIAVIGSGYVGLPLAVEFGGQFHNLGIDIDAQVVAWLHDGKDRTLATTAPDWLRPRLRYPRAAVEL